MSGIADFSDGELGRPAPPPTPVDPTGVPRGDAKLVLPHPSTYGGMTSLASRAYLYTFDEATLNSRENAIRCALDPVIIACRRLRTAAISLIPGHIEPDDPDDEQQQHAAKTGEQNFKRLPGMQTLNRWLVYDGEWKGRSAAQVRYGWVPKRGKLWHLPTLFRPVDGDKLVYKWDDTLGIIVTAAFQGKTHGTEIGDGRARAYFLTPEEREQMIVHTFEPEDEEFYRPQMAGAIHGRGLRQAIYWPWVLKNMIWGMGVDYLQWFARGLTAFYFESGNENHAKEIRAWAEAQDGQTAILFPRMKDGGPGYKPIERFEPNMANAQFIQALLTGYFDDLFRHILIGQTLNMTTAATGLGSGVAQAHEGSFEQIVKYGANLLDETRSRDLLVPYYRVNHPGMPPGRWVSDLDNPNVQQMLDAAEVIYGMGGSVPEQTLLDAAGMPEIKEGDTILANVQPMQPSAVDGMPQGVPVETGQPVQGQQPEQPARMKREAHPRYGEICRLARMGNRFASRWITTGRML